MEPASRNKVLTRSESMRVISSSKSGLSMSIHSSSSWSAFHGNSPRPPDIASRSTINVKHGPAINSHPTKKLSETQNLSRQISKPNGGIMSNREVIQRLTVGGIPKTQTLIKHRRLSLDSLPSSALPGNRMSDMGEPKSILKHTNRRVSISNGEMAAKSFQCSTLISSTAGPPSVSHLRQNNDSPSLDFLTQPDKGGEIELSDEQLLKKCQYRLAPNLTFSSDTSAKKVTFQDDILIITK